MYQKSTDTTNKFYTVRTTAMLENLKRAPSSMSGAKATSVSCKDFPTSRITLAHILWIQRLVSTEQDIARYGIRDVDVWLGGDSPDAAIYTPLPHTEIVKNLNVLIKNWVNHYEALKSQDYNSIISAIAVFHYEFLRIHPLLDGNGRVARALLRQQIVELLGRDIPNIFADKPTEYYESLRDANNDNLDSLIKLLKSYFAA